jgi:hypothetical protein
VAFRGAGLWRPLAFVIRLRFLGYEEGISFLTMAGELSYVNPHTAGALSH